MAYTGEDNAKNDSQCAADDFPPIVEVAEETVPESTESVNKPWFVAAVNEGSASGEEKIIANQIEKAGMFKLQIEADKWIRENADDDIIYASMRRGKFVRTTIVRKVEEL
jgi:hypothetical protein